MKKFIYKVIIFLVVILTAAYALDYAISSGLKRMEDYRFQTWTAIVDSKINADLLVIGNSRALSHFSPLILDSSLHLNSYNLGIGGHQFNIHNLRYQLYKEHNILPKIILLNVDFFTMQTNPFGHEREQVLPFVRDSVFQNELPKIGFSKAELYLPLFRYFGYQMVIKNGLMEFLHLHHYNTQASLKGYWPETGKWNPLALNNLEEFSTIIEKENVTKFENLIKECKRNHIQIILIYSPIFYVALNKVQNKSAFDSLFHTISQKYKVPYLDYSNDSICNDTNYFHVAIHLNKYGAEKFSRKLAIDVKKILH